MQRTNVATASPRIGLKNFTNWNSITQRLPVTHAIHRAEQLTITITATTTLTEASDAITKLRWSIFEINKESTKRWQQYILDLANISEDKGNGKRAKIFREQERRYARGQSIKQQNIDWI